MKKLLVRCSALLLGTLFIINCNKEDLSHETRFGVLKIYDINVQKVKKVHDLFAMINAHKIIFLNKSGENVFVYDDHLLQTSNTFDFKFTDVVEDPSGDFFILATEILRNQEFRLILIRLDQLGHEVLPKPIISTITTAYDYDTIEILKPYNFYYTIIENGYALGTYNNNELTVVVNYQTSQRKAWHYRILLLSENGDLIVEKDYLSDKYLISWTYLIDILPDKSIIIVRGNNVYLDIIQFNPLTLEILKTYTLNSALNFAMFTTMNPWNTDEVVFTGHADRRNNLIVAENFDIFCIKYNFKTGIITDSLFSGLVNNEELSYHSYIDDHKIIHCIGTRRGDLLSTPSIQSNLLQVNFNLATHQRDSAEYINNKGYEGLYAEPINNSPTEQRVLGSKLDISGKQNLQGFYILIKNP